MTRTQPVKSALLAILFLLVMLVVAVAQADPHFQDDFNGPTLGSGWSTSDGYRNQYPSDTANHAAFQMTGSQLSISFPGGAEHNMWRMQHAQVSRPYLGSGVYEIKVDSAMTGDQQFGLVFQQDPSTFMLFMFYSYEGREVRAYVERFALLAGGELNKATFGGVVIPFGMPSPGPHYMRVVVEDNSSPSLRTWKFDWSPDGAGWNEIISGVLETNVPAENAGVIQQVGLFAGNQPTGFHAFDAKFDHFRYYTSLATAPLSKPANLAARAGDRRVDLTWDTVQLATSYAVYAVPSGGGAPSLLGTTTQPTFAHTGLTNGVTYNYAVAGVRAGVEGARATVAAVPHVSGLATLPSQGLLLALSASELAYTQGNNSVVSVWPNAAGPALNALGTGALAPRLIHSSINGQAVVRFDGVDDHLTLPAGFQNFTAGMSLYVVMRPAALTNGFKVLALGNTEGAQSIGLGRASDTSSFQYYTRASWGEFGFFATPGGLAAGEASLLAVQQDGGAADGAAYAEITKNGTSLFGQTVFVPPVVTRSLNYIAKSYWNDGLFQGDVAEIILYNRKLSTFENGAVQAYVAGKYGITMGGSSPALGAPTNVVATAGDRSVALGWSAVTGATGYRVYRRTSSGSSYTLIASPTATTYTNTGLTNGTTYQYVVRAFNATLTSADSLAVSATPSAATLAPPTGVTATAGNGSVSLSWGAVTGASGYRVYRSATSGGPYSLLASTTSRTYSNTGLSNGTTYYYVVRAYNATVQSVDSQQVAATPTAAPPAAPGAVVATPGNGAVALSWGAVSGAASYRVYRSTTSGGPYTLVASRTATSFSDSGLTNGTTYHYVVRAFNGTLESANSAQVSATPSAPLPSPDPALPAAGRFLVLDAQTAAQQFANGAAVTTWSDISGNARHAAANGASTPVLVTNAINGRAALRFDGVDDHFTLPSGFQDFTAGMSMYVVMRPSVLTNAFKVVALGNGAGAQNIGLGRAGQTAGFQFFNTNASGQYSWFNTPDGLSAGQTSLIAVQQDGGTAGNFSYAELSKDGITLFGQQLFVPPVATRSLNYIAKTYWNEGMFQGDIAEVVLYNRKLTAQENTAVQTYLANKYGLSLGGTAPALGIPTSVAATAGNASVALSWAAVSGATGYRVLRGTTAGGPYTQIASPTGTSHSDTGVSNGTTYYYVVRAYSATQESANSQEVSATPNVTALGVPTGLAANAGNASVGLSWSSVSGATGYRVYRGTVNGGPYTLVASPTNTSHSDTGLVNGTAYYYVVRAFNGTLESANSQQVSATPVVGLPAPDPALPAAGRLLVLDAQVAAQQFANGAAVTSWSDISGSAHNAAASGSGVPTLVTNALNGRPMLRFDGVDDHFTLPSGFQDFTAGMSLYVVMRPSGLTLGFKIVALGNGAGQQNIGLGRAASTAGFQVFNTNAGGQYSWFDTAGGLVVGEASLVSVQQDAGTAGASSHAELTKNGAALLGQSMFVPPVATRSINYIGKTYWNEGMFQGDIAEVILYNRKLSASEHAAVKAYIAGKYGLSIAP
jgi:fibronectin type 3 domain-containing protein